MPIESNKARKKSQRDTRKAPPTFYDFLHAAIFDRATADAMLKANPDWIVAQSSSGETALHYAAIENHIDAVRYLLARGAEVEGREGGSTPLTDAASLGYPDMVALLLEHGAAIEAENIVEETALFAAARNGHVDLVDLLLTAGADPHHHSAFSPPLLDNALPRKRDQIAAVLARHGVTTQEDNCLPPVK